MRKTNINKIMLTTLALMAVPSLAFAQSANGAGGAPTTTAPSSSAASTDPSSGAIVPPAVVPPSLPATVGNSTLSNQPGVPNTSTPGTIGTGASPSGLPGDSPTAPGFPATGRK